MSAARPNTSGLRGGRAGPNVIPLAEAQYDETNEQMFRAGLRETVDHLRDEIEGKVKKTEISALLHALLGGL